MRQAIVTKYLGPTDSRGARVKATAQAGSLTLPWEGAADENENHATAAKALATKLEWSGRWYGGGLPDGTGNVFVQADPVISDCERGETFTVKIGG